jgi:hypothetical protein
MAIPVHCNYFADLRGILVTKLGSYGFKVEPTADTEAVLLRYYNVEQRRVRPQPRPVRWSNELRTREAALAPDVRRALATIEQSSTTGNDLNPYLSRQVVGKKKNARRYDPQFNDWGIKHMHLGEVYAEPGMIEGTKELLFVMVTDDALHFIDVGDHEDWADDHLFAIVETNWPELLADALLPGVSSDGSVGSVLTPEARLMLREKFTLATVGPSGRVYSAVGGGQVTTGLNFEVRRRADHVLRRLHELEQAHKSQGDEIAAKLAPRAGTALTELRLRLESLNPEDDEAIVLESTTGLRIVSAMIARCESCDHVHRGLRAVAIAAGWMKTGNGSWKCPCCVEPQAQPAA